MPSPRIGDDDRGMTSNPDPQAQQRARARDAANRDRFAIRRQLREMNAELRSLEREANAFDVREQHTKQTIEETWLVEHWGRQPIRPPAWSQSPAA